MEEPSDKIYLDVPFTEKEEVKALGAHWDSKKGKWYCAKDEDQGQKFSKWILRPNAIRGRSSNKSAYDGFTLSEFIYKGAPKVSRFVPFLTVEAKKTVLLSGFAQCYKCKDTSPVFALAVTSGQWANLSLKSRDTTSQVIDLPTVYAFLQRIPEEIASQIKSLTPNFRFRKSAKPMDSVYSNRCIHCEAQIKESFLHFKQEGTFSPDSLALSLSDRSGSLLSVYELKGEGEIIACDTRITFLNADNCWADTFDDRPTPDLNMLLKKHLKEPVQSHRPKVSTPVANPSSNISDLRSQYISSLATNCLINTVAQLEVDPDSWNRARLVITLPKQEDQGGVICSLQMISNEEISAQDKIVLTGRPVKMDLPDIGSIKKTTDGFSSSIHRRTLPFEKAYPKIIDLIALANKMDSEALMDYRTPANKQVKALVLSVFKNGGKSQAEITVLKQKRVR